MSETPLTDKAMLRLRAICEGNGVDAKKIELIGTEEKEFVLKAEMVLSVDVTNARSKTPGAPHAPKKGVQVVPTVAEIPAKVTALKTSLLENGEWLEQATLQLKNEPGQGFGIERAEVTLDNLVQTFQATQKCDACHGVGTNNCVPCKGLGHAPCKVCNATGLEPCYQCHGTGKNVNAIGSPCPACQGRGNVQAMQNCPQCAGRGNVQRNVQQNCPVCHGSGRDYHDQQKPCPSCHGGGHVQVMATQNCEMCHGRGQVQTPHSCTVCNGKGTMPPTPQQQTCQICMGKMQITCRTCSGNKQITCTACNGKGKTTCTVCHGEGKFTIEEVVLPVARCEFRITDTANVPSTLRHALDRNGFKMLVKAGAKIEAFSAQLAENKTATMAYNASFPFAEMRLRIAGKPMRAGVVGEKGGIRDIPAFLDHVFDVELQKLEKRIGKGNALDKAFKLRALRELFELMQSGGDVALNFRKLYPIGISGAMFTRMKGFLDRVIESSTFNIRAMVAGMMLFLLSGVYFGIIASGVRLHIAQATHFAVAYGFDILVCGLGLLAINFSLRLAAALHLRSMAPKNSGLHLKAQHAGSLGISVSVCATLIYVGLLWFLKATPGLLG